MKISDQLPGYFTFRSVYDRLLAEMPPNGIFVEVGSFAGKSAAYFLEKCLETRRTDVELLVVDHCAQYPANQLRDNLRPFDNVRFILGSKSWDIAESFDDWSIDCVFLDAGHSYNDVRRDIHAWFPKVKPGGIIAGHDYDVHTADLEGVTRAVNEWFDGVEIMLGEPWTDGKYYPSWIHRVPK